MNVNVTVTETVSGNGVCGYGVGGGRHVQIYQNDRGNALNESASAWRSYLSLCSRTDEIGPTRGVLNGPTCETDSSGDDGLRSD